MVPEAPMEDRPGGKKPAGEGWFVINARDAAWIRNEKFGAGVTFEGEPDSRSAGSTSRSCGRASPTATTTASRVRRIS